MKTNTKFSSLKLYSQEVVNDNDTAQWRTDFLMQLKLLNGSKNILHEYIFIQKNKLPF